MYPFLNTDSLFINDYRLAAMRQADCQLMREWRNQQRARLHQPHVITLGEQNLYYRNFIQPSFDHYRPPRIALSLLLRGECLACGLLEDVDWLHTRARCRMVFATERRESPATYQTEAAIFLRLILRMAFEQAGLSRIGMAVPAGARVDQRVLRETGFVEEGRLRGYYRENDELEDALTFSCLNHDYRKNARIQPAAERAVSG
mgnify:CR=1 FL=1